MGGKLDCLGGKSVRKKYRLPVPQQLDKVAPDSRERGWREGVIELRERVKRKREREGGREGGGRENIYS